MEKTLKTDVVFTGRVVRLEVVDIALDNGRVSQREIVRHPGAVVLLAERPDGRFVFVRQYRKAIESDLLEAVAGTLEPNEDPIVCAERELREESGYKALSLTALGVIVPAPGYSSERLHLFHARTEAIPGDTDPDDDERITVVLLTRQEIETAIGQGALIDAKTLAAWTMYVHRMG